MIIVVATEDDLTASAVVNALHKAGRKDVLWLDLEQAHEKVSLHFTADETGVHWRIQSRENPELVADQDTVAAVYWRRPVKVLGSPFLGIPSRANLDPLEVFWSIRWILESLPVSRFPLGHPLSFARSENKHRQM